MHKLHFCQPSLLRAGNGSGLYVAGHYSDFRQLCHQLKTGDSLAIREAASIISSEFVFPQDTILIPMPSHIGHSTDMLTLTECISHMTGIPFLDALQGNSRQSVYDAKKHGHILTGEELGFRLKADIPDGLRPLILDNVIATGLTAGAALDVIPDASVIALAIDIDKFVPR